MDEQETTPGSHTVVLTDEQLVAVFSLFQSRGWQMVLQGGLRAHQMEEAAEDYIQQAQLNGRSVVGGRDSPTEDKPDKSPPMRKIRDRPGTKKFGASFELDKDGKDMQTMRTIGSTYIKNRSTIRRETSASPTAAVGGQWRRSIFNIEGEGNPVSTDVVFNHYCVVDNNMAKIITKLSTENVDAVSQVPVRIVLLVDRSGSMLHKLGRDARHAKITQVKHFAKQLIAALDDGDQAGLVTFGDTAEEFFPLQTLNKDTRMVLQEKLNSLDKGNMSRSTNLSEGLRIALKSFYNVMKRPADYLACKNSILVFSDGEINAGTMETNSLVHEVRQNIRQMMPSMDDSQNQWVTISVVTTGTTISETLYMLSKTCSSEAYYYIDNNTVDPEAELFLPVLLRKTAVAWNISCVVETYHGIQFVEEKCSKENRIRLRHNLRGSVKGTEKAFFLYDFPAGHTRQLGVCGDLGPVKNKELDDEETLFKIRVEFTNISGERFWQEQLVTMADIKEAEADVNNEDAKLEACKYELKLVSADILHNAAEQIKAGDRAKSKIIMEDGQRDLKALMEAYGRKSEVEASKKDVKTTEEVGMYVKSVVDNIGCLIDALEKSSDGAAWNRVKAVSTAISRESPNVSNAVVNCDVLCPLPDVSQTGGMKSQYDKLVEEYKKRKRITFGNLDQMLDEVLSP